jgi:membrane protease YdiL (CAAX protease family)
VTLILMAAGGVAVVVAWRLVAAGRVSIWPAMSATLGLVGVAALATGRVPLSPRLGVGSAVAVGLGAGLALYLITVAFVLVVRRWPVFDRHVEEIYDQRKGLPFGLALLLAAGVTAPGEELFWRGLFQARMAETIGWVGAAAATWAAYVTANLASANLPIIAGGIVAGASWGALALLSHGVLPSVLSHVVWTGLMLALPPGGSRSRRSESGVPANGTAPPQRATG